MRRWDGDRGDARGVAPAQMSVGSSTMASVGGEGQRGSWVWGCVYGDRGVGSVAMRRRRQEEALARGGMGSIGACCCDWRSSVGRVLLGLAAIRRGVQPCRVAGSRCACVRGWAGCVGAVVCIWCSDAEAHDRGIDGLYAGASERALTGVLIGRSGAGRASTGRAPTATRRRRRCWSARAPT